MDGGIVSDNGPLNCSRRFVPSTTKTMGKQLGVYNILDGFTLQFKTKETLKSSDPITWEH